MVADDLNTDRTLQRPGRASRCFYWLERSDMNITANSEHGKRLCVPEHLLDAERVAHSHLSALHGPPHGSTSTACAAS